MPNYLKMSEFTEFQASLKGGRKWKLSSKNVKQKPQKSLISKVDKSFFGRSIKFLKIIMGMLKKCFEAPTPTWSAHASKIIKEMLEYWNFEELIEITEQTQNLFE